MKKASILLRRINEMTAKYPHIVYDEIYHFLYEKELYLLAYEKILNNFYYNNHVKYHIQLLQDQDILMLIDNLKQEQYDIYVKFYFNQHRKNNRYLFLNYVLQEVVCLLLEAMYNLNVNDKKRINCWLNHSIHVELQQIKNQLPHIQWIIQGNLIDECFGKQLDLLIKNHLFHKIKDAKFLRLIQHLLHNFTLYDLKRHSLTKNIDNPENRLIYFLWDTFYTKLDHFINKLFLNNSMLTEFSFTLNKTNNISENNKATQFKSQEDSFNQKIDTKSAISVPYNYIRFGNHFFVFIHKQIPYQYSLYLKNQLYVFIKEIHLINDQISSLKLLNVKYQPVYYVGYKIFYDQQTIYLEISKLDVLKLLEKYKFIQYNKYKKIRPISQTKLLCYSDYKIIEAYNSIWYNLRLYYASISNKKHIKYFHYLFIYSCAMTLAHKHKSSVTKIFRKYKKQFLISKRINKVTQDDFLSKQYLIDPFFKYK